MADKKLEINVNWAFVVLVLAITGGVFALFNPEVVKLMFDEGLLVIQAIGKAF